jgi:hypothetical protein
VGKASGASGTERPRPFCRVAAVGAAARSAAMPMVSGLAGDLGGRAAVLLPVLRLVWFLVWSVMRFQALHILIHGHKVRQPAMARVSGVFALLKTASDFRQTERQKAPIETT